MLRNYFLLTAFLLVAIQSMAQAPSGVPYGQPEPLEFDLVNIIVFIIVPALIILLYIGFKRKNRKK
ncbi:hypothetical protein [Maribellus sp. YY47]|uniref:hypothetical protein n=1 Tax=Maribellus sp. YY47 TaxID=2929486 RepID=UPI0020014D00|nr:hypothetical protein [Maribellus sp. YY47]MCK3684972.1 hypothetical protein [Maribellus sp. YY47]